MRLRHARADSLRRGVKLVRRPGAPDRRPCSLGAATCQYALVPFAFALPDGWLVLLVFLVAVLLAVAYGSYTRRGSAINQHPYDDPSGDAPGTQKSTAIGHDADGRDVSRGTR